MNLRIIRGKRKQINWGLFTGPEVHSPGIISKKTLN